ncbi:MAG: Xaa-Pro peptidase family protein [Chryseolinea sp.]
MIFNRRNFLRRSSLATGAGVVASLNSFAATPQKYSTSIAVLTPMTDNVVPISVKEREGRIARAQQLLVESKIEALILDAGTTMKYFTGVSWYPSERPTLVIIPSKGDVRYVCPGFEEPRLRELIKIGKDVYAWQEDESPFKLVANVLKDSGIRSGNIAMEERVRFFIFDGIRKEASVFNFVSGDPVTVECRIIKSPAELALMQIANDITVAAIKSGISSLKEGMTPDDFSNIVTEAHQKLGAVPDFAGVNFAQASAFPHGSTQPQKLKRGDIVLMDCGCLVEGYSSDVSRTIVFGAEPTPRQIEIWNLEKKAQLAGFAAATPGHPCEDVDAAARKVLTNAGFGPGYKLPGLPHRTGHGIGMDGHEWGNMVKGNKRLLKPGMCFSIEPNISIVGEFGIRLEDCVYVTEGGPKWFTQPSVSIGQPFVV